MAVYGSRVATAYLKLGDVPTDGRQMGAALQQQIPEVGLTCVRNPKSARLLSWRSSPKTATRQVNLIADPSCKAATCI